MADIRFERDEKTVVAILTGEVDMSNAAWVRHQIAGFIMPADDAVIVDMSDLSFMDSAGLHAVVELGTMLEERRQQLRLCVPDGSHIKRAIEIVGLQRTVRVHADLGEAMEAVRASAMESRPIGPTDNV
jgi:anti-anti-sigma factor